MKTLRVISILLLLSGCLLSNARAQEGDTKPLSDLPKQFAATAFGQAGAAAGKSFGLTIYITGWTPNEQISENIGILKAKGQDGLVSAMEKTDDVGRVSPTGSVGTGLRFTHFRKTANGGLHIVVATNRPITFGELYNMTRSTDYPFSILVLDVDSTGKGSGKFAPLCKVKFNKQNQLEIENYGIKPFRLSNIYVQK
jgi:hypothetical protein